MSGRPKHRSIVAPAFCVALALLASAVSAGELRLSKRIPPADPATYRPLMANEWPNPRVLVDTDGVFLFEDGSTHPGTTVPIDKLAVALVKLPVRRWPWGRVIALSLSPRMPRWTDGVSRDDDPQFRTLVEARAVLRSLGLEVVESPVGCHCQ